MINFQPVFPVPAGTSIFPGEEALEGHGRLFWPPQLHLMTRAAEFMQEILTFTQTETSAEYTMYGHLDSFCTGSRLGKGNRRRPQPALTLQAGHQATRKKGGSPMHSPPGSSLVPTAQLQWTPSLLPSPFSLRSHELGTRIHSLKAPLVTLRPRVGWSLSLLLIRKHCGMQTGAELSCELIKH